MQKDGSEITVMFVLAYGDLRIVVVFGEEAVLDYEELVEDNSDDKV